MVFDLPWKLIACDFGFQVEKNMPASAAAVGCGVSLGTFWVFFGAMWGYYWSPEGDIRSNLAVETI